MVEEALRVSAEAERRNETLRLLGGVAIKIKATDGLNPAFRRRYADLDWIVSRGKSAATQKLFDSLGYSPQTRFNALYGSERLLFFDETNDRQVDVLVGSFKMCHAIPFGKRLDLETVTIPMAELLLTKLQIVELNEKDVGDSLAILHHHSVEETDGDAINAAHIAKLCAADWGLWRTITANLESLPERLAGYELSDESKERVTERVRTLRTRIDAEDKPFSWRMRDKIGDRKRWYDLPEEVEGGP